MNGVNAKAEIKAQTWDVTIENATGFTVDYTDYKDFGIKWKLTIERVDDDLSLFFEPLEPVDYKVVFVANVMNVDNHVAHMQIYYGDFRNGTVSRIGSSKYISWDSIVNPRGSTIIKADRNEFIVQTTLTVVRPCDCALH